MPGTHRYATELTWTGNTGSGTATYRSYRRTCEVRAEGKPPLAGSSDPHFRGAADRGVVVVDYSDAASGTLRTEGTGGRMTEVVLRPVVTVAEPEMAAACA